ncbi:MAG: hypothetical protein AAGF73_04750 [Actinomycetota bacterium]
MERSPFTGEWRQQVQLDGPGTFGHDINYSWGLLTVSDGAGLVRVYRDTGFQPWSHYGDWSQVDTAGGGRQITSAGGSQLRVRLVETYSPTTAGFSTITTHAG